MNIYILTSDKSNFVIKALQYCINKFWKPNPKVFILGYKEPAVKLEKNFTFVSLGEDRGPEHVGGDLIRFFSKIKDKHFIFSVDDFLPIRKVNKKMLTHLKQKMRLDSVGRISLTDQVSDKQHSVVEQLEQYNIIEMAQNANYRKSAVWSLWSKEYFLKYLNPKMTLWQWELDERCKGDGIRILGTNTTFIMQSCHLFKRGKLKADWVTDSESDDVMFEKDQKVVSEIIGIVNE